MAVPEQRVRVSLAPQPVPPADNNRSESGCEVGTSAVPVVEPVPRTLGVLSEVDAVLERDD